MPETQLAFADCIAIALMPQDLKLNLTSRELTSDLSILGAFRLSIHCIAILPLH
jgi:hypothetical protein